VTRTAHTLTEMYEAMLAAHGHRGWWPSSAGADTPEGKLEIAVGAILTQNTNWRNVQRAIGNLQTARVMSLGALNALPHEQLAELIRPAGYFNIKAKRLKNFLAHVVGAFGEDIAAFLDRPVGVLREELLSINGIGRETADSIILYAAGRPSFVVDAYTARILFRHHLIAPEDGYDEIQALFESSLPENAALWNDYHAQLVEVGKRFCRKSRPKCQGCPLEALPHDAMAGMEEY